MSVFFHLSSLCANAITKFFFAAFCVFVLILSGCNEPELSRPHDITENLYHRLKAGMFEPEKDPFFIRIVSAEKSKRDQSVVENFVCFSWERGTFWVKVDEGAAIVMYLDTEAIFSHINFFTDRQYKANTLFSEHPRLPVVTTGFSSD